MKNTIIRLFVVVLALTGAAATAHSKTTGHVAVAFAAAPPVPMCPIHDPKACGID